MKADYMVRLICALRCLKISEHSLRYKYLFEVLCSLLRTEAIQSRSTPGTDVVSAMIDVSRKFKVPYLWTMLMISLSYLSVSIYWTWIPDQTVFDFWGIPSKVRNDPDQIPDPDRMIYGIYLYCIDIKNYTDTSCISYTKFNQALSLSYYGCNAYQRRQYEKKSN